MAEFEWTKFLVRWNQALLRDPNVVVELSADVVASGWLGYPAATDMDIAQAEERLGTTLPQSYRDFLRVSNGWRQPTWYIPKLWSTEEVEWFSVRNQDWIDIANEDSEPVPDEDYFVYGKEQMTYNIRTEYLRAALEISASGDGAVFLLNPQVVITGGEWEAWLFANKYPGAARFHSFLEMMQEQYENSSSRLQARGEGDS